jgi:hypothetical protein
MVVQFGKHRRVEGVQHLRAIQRENSHTLIVLAQNIWHDGYVTYPSVQINTR